MTSMKNWYFEKIAFKDILYSFLNFWISLSTNIYLWILHILKLINHFRHLKYLRCIFFLWKNKVKKTEFKAVFFTFKVTFTWMNIIHAKSTINLKKKQVHHHLMSKDLGCFSSKVDLHRIKSIFMCIIFFKT